MQSDGPLPAAQTHGLTAAALAEQFGRLGDTPYVLDGVELDLAGKPLRPRRC